MRWPWQQEQAISKLIGGWANKPICPQDTSSKKPSTGERHERLHPDTGLKQVSCPRWCLPQLESASTGHEAAFPGLLLAFDRLCRSMGCNGGRDLGCISLTRHVSSPKVKEGVFCLLSGHWLFHHQGLSWKELQHNKAQIRKKKREFCCQGWNHSKGHVSEGSGIHLLSSAEPAVFLQRSAWGVSLGLAGLQSELTRDVFAAVRRLVAAALQILWTGQSFLPDFFFFFF